VICVLASVRSTTYIIASGIYVSRRISGVAVAFASAPGSHYISARQMPLTFERVCKNTAAERAEPCAVFAGYRCETIYLGLT
jgi:hypothetical protein